MEFFQNCLVRGVFTKWKWVVNFQKSAIGAPLLFSAKQWRNRDARGPWEFSSIEALILIFTPNNTRRSVSCKLLGALQGLKSMGPLGAVLTLTLTLTLTPTYVDYTNGTKSKSVQYAMACNTYPLSAVIRNSET